MGNSSPALEWQMGRDKGPLTGFPIRLMGVNEAIQRGNHQYDRVIGRLAQQSQTGQLGQRLREAEVPQQKYGLSPLDFVFSGKAQGLEYNDFTAARST